MNSNNDELELLYEEASHAANTGKFAEAFLAFSELAELGHAGALLGLGNRYLRGEGVSQNVENGLKLLEQAAALGLSMAAFSLGALHRSGDCGVPIDPERSRQFFRLAKELGCKLPVEEYL